LFDVIANLSDDLVLYPGHDYVSSSTSTIGKEKQTNPVKQKMSENEFIERMGGKSYLTLKFIAMRKKDKNS